MEFTGSLLSSQETITGTCPRPNESIDYIHSFNKELIG
jgi:hypothetical protein